MAIIMVQSESLWAFPESYITNISCGE